MAFPRKLKKDCIVEALCELRFESSEVDELIVGRLTDGAPWDSFVKTRLPFADLPPPMRKANPQFQFQPTIQFKDPNLPLMINLGPNTISTNVLAPYCGWNEFRPKIELTMEQLYSRLPDVVLSRIGLRYVNIITPEHHLVDEITSLKINISVGGEPLRVPLNLTYQKDLDDKKIVVRIASPSFVVGVGLPAIYTALVDVDVATPDGFPIPNAEAAKAWIEEAHNLEKEEFFRLWPEELLNKLVEE